MQFQPVQGDPGLSLTAGCAYSQLGLLCKLVQLTSVDGVQISGKVCCGSGWSKMAGEPLSPFKDRLSSALQIVELMAEEKGWWRWKAGREQRRAEDFLSTFTSDPSAPGTKDKSQERMDLVSSHEKGGGA